MICLSIDVTHKIPDVAHLLWYHVGPLNFSLASASEDLVSRCGSVEGH